MNKHLFLFSFLLFLNAQATETSSPEPQAVRRSNHHGVAHLLGTAQAIQLAYFRDRFVTANPNATQQDINQHMSTLQQNLITNAQEFLAQQMPGNRSANR